MDCLYKKKGILCGFYTKELLVTSFMTEDHVEISPLICSANQWSSFHITRTLAIKELSIPNAIQKFDRQYS